MKFDPKIHHRRSIRLQKYDYAQAGAYYITTVVCGREHLLGAIQQDEMRLNKYGQIIQYAWLDLPNHYPHVELGAFCIMPNHMHGIIILNDVERAGIKRHPLPEIVRAFKSFSARRINAVRKMPGTPFWQRNYYEHVIRNDQDHRIIQEYILSNPLNWEKDDENR
jgi:REP element-mobilizing transposase RayT